MTHTVNSISLLICLCVAFLLILHVCTVAIAVSVSAGIVVLGGGSVGIIAIVIFMKKKVRARHAVNYPIHAHVCAYTHIMYIVHANNCIVPSSSHAPCVLIIAW